jgi:predicted transcriptional regulator YdeE
MGVSKVKVDAFKAIGVRWQGTFQQAQAGEIKELMQQFRESLNELPEGTDKTTILGVSYDVTKEGFTYYLCCKVLDQVQAPEGMELISVPTLTCASYDHATEENVGDSYSKVYQWITENNLTVNDEINLEHLEMYPADYHPINEPPRLKIHIPIKDKK